MEYVPDADMIFNYLMISALAAATDYIEREGLKPTGGKLDNVSYVWCKRFSYAKGFSYGRNNLQR